MRFLVFGAGALGSVVAARLADAHEVALVGRRAHVDAINERGLRITGHTEVVQTSIDAATDTASLRRTPEAVLLTVKAYDTAAVMAALAGYRDTSIFVSLQNGLGNEEAMAAGGARVLGAVINHGATFIGPGEVFHAGSSTISIGPFADTNADDAGSIATALAEVGLPAAAVTDIRERIWAKAILNAAVNPLSALLRKKTGELIDSEPIVEAMRQVVDESVAIAAACGIDLQVTDILDTIHAVAEATRDNKSSMYQDVEMGRRTEIEAINGTLIARAKEHGLACPANELLANMIRAAEAAGS